MRERVSVIADRSQVEESTKRKATPVHIASFNKLSVKHTMKDFIQHVKNDQSCESSTFIYTGPDLPPTS